MLKGYMVFSGHQSEGCELIFAHNRNQARANAHLFDWPYAETSAWREPDIDDRACGDQPYSDDSDRTWYLAGCWKADDFNQCECCDLHQYASIPESEVCEKCRRCKECKCACG